MEKPIIVITGPTASGKTALSLVVAKTIKAEIICADSMTVYRGMDIGTDKPTLKLGKKKGDFLNSDGSYDIEGTKHHLLDILDPDQEFNVAIFKKLVDNLIEKIHERGNIPILVGGSAMYLDAVIYNYNFPKVEPDEKLRSELNNKSNHQLFADLVKLDPDAEWTVDKNNKRRLIRALEVTLKSGQPFTTLKSKKKIPKNILYLALKREREILYSKINHRVDEMMEEELLEEVKKLYKKYSKNTALQATGYRQLIDYIEGVISLQEAVEQTKKSHRNFAKRQITWFSRNKDIIWIENEKEAKAKIRYFLNKK